MKISNSFKENTKGIIEIALLSYGTMFCLGGLYEFFTAEKIPLISAAANSDVVNLINTGIEHLNYMPLQMKLGGGSSCFMVASILARNRLKNKPA